MATSGNRQTLTADGQTTYVKVVGPVRISITGDFGTGTAKVQVKDPSDAAVDVANASYTAAADLYLEFPPKAINEIRVDLSGSVNPALVVWVQSSERSTSNV